MPSGLADRSTPLTRSNVVDDYEYIVTVGDLPIVDGKRPTPAGDGWVLINAFVFAMPRSSQRQMGYAWARERCAW